MTADKLVKRKEQSMKNIKRWFENDTVNSGQHYDVYEYDGHLEAKTDSALFMAVSPHDGTNNKWMLRVTPITSFDRWANSTAVEEFFGTDIELCNYLYEHQLDIYKMLLERLSEDYRQLEEAKF